MNTSTKITVDPIEVTRVALDSLREIIGQGGLQAILKTDSLPFFFTGEEIHIESEFGLCDWRKLLEALQGLYGLRGAQGIAVRSGQVFFKDYYRSFGFTTGMMERDFRMLAKPNRILRGLQILAELQNHYLPFLSVDVFQDAEQWFWRVRQCDWLVQNPGLIQILNRFAIGVIQEFLSWTSGGKFYPVSELASTDSKSGVVIRILKKYID